MANFPDYRDMVSGLMGSFTFGAGSQAINAAATYWAVSVMQLSARTLSKIKIPILSVTGSPITSDIVVEIRSNATAAGGPQPSGTVLASGNPTSVAAGYIQVTGLSLALSANTRYWIVIRNANASPAANYITVGGVAGAANAAADGMQMHRMGSTNSGTTWSQAAVGFLGLMLEYSNADTWGFPAKNYGTSNAIASQFVIHQKLLGNRITVGPIPLTINGVITHLQRNGTPTTGYLAKIFKVSDNSLVATSLPIPLLDMPLASPNLRIARLSNSLILSANTEYRIVYGAEDITSANSVTNSWFAGTMEIDSTVGSMPYSAYETYSTDNGANWTDNANRSTLFSLSIPYNNFALAYAPPSTGQLWPRGN